MQWATFPELLGHMPNLKLFVLNKVISSVILRRWFCVLLLASSKYFDFLLLLLSNYECRSRWGRETSENRPKCLAVSLEKFVFRGCEGELMLLRYVLENATVLKKLSLTRSTNPNANKGTRAQIDSRVSKRLEHMWDWIALKLGSAKGFFLFFGPCSKVFPLLLVLRQTFLPLSVNDLMCTFWEYACICRLHVHHWESLPSWFVDLHNDQAPCPTVQELVISFTKETIVELPRNLFKSVDLVVLKLTWNVGLSVSFDGTVFAASQGSPSLSLGLPWRWFVRRPPLWLPSPWRIGNTYVAKG